MRVRIVVTLDSGGQVTVEGSELSGDDIRELFHVLSGARAMSLRSEPEPIDTPLPGKQ